MHINDRDVEDLTQWEKTQWTLLASYVNRPVPEDMLGTVFGYYLQEAKLLVAEDWATLQTIYPPLRCQVFPSSRLMKYPRYYWMVHWAAIHAQRAQDRLARATPIKRPIYENQYQMTLLNAEKGVLNLRLLAHRTRGKLKDDVAEIPL